MTEASNNLTPAESERLALLAEELSEAVQAVCKVLRHGYESFNPFDPDRVTNRRSLEIELGHVRHAMIRLCEAGDLEKRAIHDSADAKRASVAQWLHHQEEFCG